MALLWTFPVGPIQCNCVVMACGETREAVVIDPGEEEDRILEVLSREKLTCKTILLTHGHLDHVGAAAPLAAATAAKVLLHRDDLFLYEHVAEQAATFGFSPPPTVPIDRYINDGDTIRTGRIEGTVLHTPGHSPGGICLLLTGEADGAGGERPVRPPYLFSGDTLFAGSIGRTDLWGGDYDRLIRSIRERLLPLPDETIVIPGHGEATTIGRERRMNPFLSTGRED